MASSTSHSNVQRINANHTEVVEVETVLARGDQSQNKNHIVRVVEDDDDDEGVFLTWEDLWVRVSNSRLGDREQNSGGGRSSCRSILQGVSGYARPGQLLAIMGPSGGGKSTLLDALAGRLSSNTRQTGKILINGHIQALAYGTSAYVTQDDTLMATLTAQEAVHYSAQLQLPDSMSMSEKKQRALVAIREMGLQDAMNTRIGNWGAKGLSGGEKRRVSICIELLTRPKLLFLDEPTSGLDSAASFYVMSRIANLGHNVDSYSPRIVIASIHQPSSEVFQLFDNLCLLSSGRTVYFGPASAANEFFASSGFPCPTLQNPSDHFLKTINKDFEQDLERSMRDGAMPTEEAIDILIQSYKTSETYHQLQTQIALLNKKDCNALGKRCHAGFLTQCFVLTRRSFVNMYRDRGYYWLRLVVYIALALSLGTIYHDLGHTNKSIQERGSLLAFVASFLTFMAIGGFPSFVEEMKVFEQERLNGHYGVSAFVFGNTFSSVPYLMLISLIPAATYYLAGLHRGFEHFFFFASTLFACMMLVESLMMIVASIVPNFLMGIIAGAGLQGIMILCGGFFRRPNDLPHVLWKYPLYHIAFHKYAYQGMFKNEFEGTEFPNNKYNQAGGGVLSGEDILRDIWEVEMGYSKWIDLAVLLGMIILYRALFLVIIKVTEKVNTLLSVAPKRTSQVLANPSSTLLHGERSIDRVGTSD